MTGTLPRRSYERTKTNSQKRCPVHHWSYHRGGCWICVKEAKERAILKRLELEGLIPQIKRLAGKCRRADVVAERRLLVRRLSRDGLAAATIGRLLNRHHTTILHLRKCQTPHYRPSSTTEAQPRGEIGHVMKPRNAIKGRAG